MNIFEIKKVILKLDKVITKYDHCYCYDFNNYTIVINCLVLRQNLNKHSKFLFPEIIFNESRRDITKELLDNFPSLYGWKNCTPFSLDDLANCIAELKQILLKHEKLSIFK